MNPLSKTSAYSLFYISLLIIAPILFILFIVAPEPLGKAVHFGNDFSEHRIWWHQTKSFFINNGFIPLWNPLDHFGVIYPGWRGFSLFYPLSWHLYFPFFIWGKYNYLLEYSHVVLHTAIGLSGIFFLIKKNSKVSNLAAITGTLPFILNQRFIDNIRYPNTIETVAWVPWILYFLLILLNSSKETNNKLIPTANLKDLLFLILFVAMCWLAGYGHLTYIAFILFAIFLLVYVINLKNTIIAGCGLIIGSFAAIGVLLPTALQNMNSDTRGGGNIDYADSIPLESYIDMFIRPFSIDVHVNSYFPIVFLFFIVLGLAYSKYYQTEIKTTLAMLIGLLILADLSMGRNGFLFTFFYNHVPFYHSFRIQGRNNWITMIPVCYFCAMGVQAFLTTSNKNKSLIIGGIFIASIIAVYMNYLQSGYESMARFSPFYLKWISVDESIKSYFMLSIILPVFLILFILLRSKFLKLASLSIVLFVFCNYYAIHSTWFDNSINRLGAIPVKKFYSEGLFHPFLRGSDNRIIYPIVASDRRNLDEYEKYNNIVNTKVVGNSSRFCFFTRNNPMDNDTVQLKVLAFNPNYIRYNVETTTEGDLLYFSSYSPLWKSNVSFRKGSNGFQHFTVFNIPKGTSEIEFSFRPQIIIISSLITLVSIFIISSTIFNSYKKKKLSTATLLFGILIIIFFLAGVYSNKSFPSQHMYKNIENEKAITTIPIKKGEV